MRGIKISMVTPTLDRRSELVRLLRSIQRQTYQPSEIIIVDATDDIDYHEDLKKEFSFLPLKFLHSPPSVCKQRNVGITEATNEWIFLCDDDIELPEEYLENLKRYLDHNPSCGAVAGVLLQQERNGWAGQYPPKNFFELVWRFIFQLPVWGEINNIRTPFPFTFIFKLLKRHYKKKGNTMTKAGWPLITQWTGENFQTTFYSLGANLILKKWLVVSPYDETLDKNGIGDNYGVALNFPQPSSIHVVNSTKALHHRSTKNRMQSEESYFKRIVALHHFIKTYPTKFSKNATGWLLWSLIGNLISFLIARNMLMMKATWRAALTISSSTSSSS